MQGEGNWRHSVPAWPFAAVTVGVSSVIILATTIIGRSRLTVPLNMAATALLLVGTAIYLVVQHFNET